LPEEDLHVALVLVLTLGTGAVDAVSYFSLDHVFTANMSGNMALLGIGIADHSGWRYGVCFVLAAAMGIQTGVARHMSVKDVNTTVATMTLHDLAAASKLAGGDSVRWKRRAGVVVALLGGAAIGIGLDNTVSWGGLAFTCLTTLGVIAAVIAVQRREPTVD